MRRAQKWTINIIQYKSNHTLQNYKSAIALLQLQNYL